MDTESGQGQFTSSEKEIRRLLTQAQTGFFPVTVHFHGVQAFFTSYVVEVDADKNVFMLDEVVPESGNEKVRSGLPFNMETFVDGVRVRAMDIKASAGKASDGGSVFVAKLPDQLHTLQRRQSYRAPVRKTLHIPVDVGMTAKEILTGELQDFSMEGCQVSFAGDLVEQFDAISTPMRGRMRFPNEESLSAKMLPRRARYDEVLEKTFVGIRFMQLSSKQIKIIAHVFSELQRDHINAIKNGAHISGVPDLFKEPEGLPAAASSEAVQDEKKPKDDSKEKPAANKKPAEEQVASESQPLKQTLPADMALENACVAVKMALRCVAKDLPFDRAHLEEVSFDLLQALKLERNNMMLRLCVRHFHEQWVEHSVAVAVWLVDTMHALQPELDDKVLANIIQAGLVHALPRVHMASVSDWLNLQAKERTDLSKHILTQRQRVQDSGLASEAEIIIGQVLERSDGSGIPSAINSDIQHSLAKVASVIDAFAMLAFNGEYDQYYQPVVAYRKLLRMSDQFDQDLIKKFVGRIGVMPVGSCVQLDNGLIGIILSVGAKRKPQHIRLLIDSRTNKFIAPADVRIEPPVQVQGLVDPAKHKLSSEHLLPLPDFV